MIANLKKNKKKGFTLVELIVVIAIIAIIAAVAVPTTISYVNKAKVSTAQNEANELANALNTAFTEYSLNSTELTKADFIGILNGAMGTVNAVTGIEVKSGSTATAFTIIVKTNATDDGTAVTVEKTYNLSNLGLSINSDCIATYTAPSGDTGWA